MEEILGHLDRLLGGGKAVAEVVAAKRGNPALAGQLRHVGVQIHAVEALQFHDDMFVLELGETVVYFHGEFRLGICSPEYGATAACRQISGACGGRAAQPGSLFDERAQPKHTDKAGPQTAKAPHVLTHPRTRHALAV